MPAHIVLLGSNSYHRNIYRRLMRASPEPAGATRSSRPGPRPWGRETPQARRAIGRAGRVDREWERRLWSATAELLRRA